MAKYEFSIPTNLLLAGNIDRLQLVNAVQSEINKGSAVKESKTTTLAMSKTTGKGGDRETSIYFASKTTGERLKVPTSKIARFAAWCLAVQALTQWEGESADMAPVASEWEQWVNQFAK